MDELIVALCVISALLSALAVIFTVKASRRSGFDQRDFRNLNDIVSGRNEEQTNQIERLIKMSMTGNEAFGKQIAERVDKMEEAVEKHLGEIRNETKEQLEKVRQTVDDKLAENFEKRFAMISTRMDSLLKGLGEMKELSNNVGSLKNVLTNVKTRGTWGEVSLNALLEQILTEKQFRRFVQVKRNSQERVDFAIVMPGKGDEVLLPIDSKFPTEDYQRIVEASERGDGEALIEATRALEKRIKEQARSIRDKYIQPPVTTDFAIMYLPTEGLYAEVLKANGLAEKIQNEYKVTVCGPTVLSALLNSLQLGFQTIAIEKNSLEIKNHLVRFKREFEAFSNEIAKSRNQMETATNSIGKVMQRTERISKNLSAIGGEEVQISSEDDFCLTEESPDSDD